MTGDDEATFLCRLGDRVRLLRLARRLSQIELASRAGISRVFLSAVERGRHGANVLALRRLATALDLRLPELVDIDEAPHSIGHVTGTRRPAAIKDEGRAGRRPGRCAGAGDGNRTRTVSLGS
jgi:transcriptional regulator with XRE-family HTH domain